MKIIRWLLSEVSMPRAALIIPTVAFIFLGFHDLKVQKDFMKFRESIKLQKYYPTMQHDSSGKLTMLVEEI